MRTIRLYLFAVIALFNFAAANAETSSSSESTDLGVWCYIDLDFDNDAVDANGYFIYTKYGLTQNTVTMTPSR